MKKLLLILIALPMIGFGQNVNIPDANFKAYLVGNSAINTNGDAEIQVSEAAIFGGGINCSNSGIFDLTGIDAFTNLDSLLCDSNSLTYLDITSNGMLRVLSCSHNALTSLDVTGMSLQIQDELSIDCSYNQLTSLDLSSLYFPSNASGMVFIDIDCSHNQINSLNLIGPNWPDWNSLIDCSYNELISLDLPDAGLLDCSNNLLTSLDLNDIGLEGIDCSYNQLTTLDIIDDDYSLFGFFCSHNQLTSITFTNAEFPFFMCDNNLLTNLDMSGTDLKYGFSCSNNNLYSLNMKNVDYISIDSNFSATNNPNLFCINVDNTNWSTANWTNIDLQHYFSANCPPPSSIMEHSTNKELLKVTDLLGRETKETNQPLFYIYDDGTVEKRIVIE